MVAASPSKEQGEELVKIDLAGEGEESQPIFLTVSLAAKSMPQPHEGVQDVFAWTYAQMPKLELQLVTCKLNIKERSKPANRLVELPIGA